jgi:hypothetical protein
MTIVAQHGDGTGTPLRPWPVREHGLVQIRPRGRTAFISRDRTCLVADEDGFVEAGSDGGLFIHETRVLSRYRYLVDGAKPRQVVLAAPSANAWMGYYTAPARVPDGGAIGEPPEQVIEVRLSRAVGDGLLEDVDLVNYTQQEVAFTLARAQIETAALFENLRLPEVLSGHTRDADHPFPALYTETNWPQAWSASSLVAIAQALVGIYPFAPLHLLLVDPHLPEWLPEVGLQDLRIGDAIVSLRFFRDADGRSDFEVTGQRGRLHVLRQPSPWSLEADLPERVEDLLRSFI